MARQESKGTGTGTENEPFESDAKKLADKHLADPNHVITDEELRSIKVGAATPPPDAPTEQAIEESEDRTADKKADSDDEIFPGAQKTTPWDLVE